MKHVYPILFLHIPKSAGITLHDILHREYPELKHKVIYAVKEGEQFQKSWSVLRNRYKVIRGHFLFGMHDYVKGDAKYITMLRNPVDRTISGYNFIKVKTDHPFYNAMKTNNYSLREFLEGKFVANFDNIAVRFLSGNHHLPFGEINQSHFENAKKNLMDSKMVFGITERFDESVLLFKRVLNWKSPWYKKQNESVKHSSVIDERTMQIIQETNRFDLQLYEFACNVFQERINGCGDEFKAELTNFIEENKNHSNTLVSSGLMEKINQTISRV